MVGGGLLRWDFNPRYDRFGSIATEPPSLAYHPMSAILPIATKIARRRNMSRWAHFNFEIELKNIVLVALQVFAFHTAWVICRHFPGLTGCPLHVS